MLLEASLYNFVLSITAIVNQYLSQLLLSITHGACFLQQSFLVRRMRNPTKCDPANFVTAFRAFGQHPQRLGRLILRSAHIAKTSACICRIVLNFLY